IKYIYPDAEKQTSSYATLIHHNNLYIGTSNGVYYNPIHNINQDLSLSKHAFKEVKNTAGQVWSLKQSMTKYSLAMKMVPTSSGMKMLSSFILRLQPGCSKHCHQIHPALLSRELTRV